MSTNISECGLNGVGDCECGLGDLGADLHLTDSGRSKVTRALLGIATYATQMKTALDNNDHATVKQAAKNIMARITWVHPFVDHDYVG